MDSLNQKPSNFSLMPKDQPAPPPPPPPEISLRTMKSDISSIKETGGAAPRPFTPPEIKREIPPLPPLPPLTEQKKITPSEFGLPAEIKKVAPAIIEEEAPGKTAAGKTKKIFIWGSAAVIIIAVGWLGYSFIFPMLFPSQSPPPPAITSPTETPEVPEVTIPEAEEAQVLTHQSLLKASDAAANIELISVDLLSLTNALKQEAQKTLAEGTLVEITLSDANGQIPLSIAVPALLPDLSPEDLFEEDFTTALYYDSNGVWPIYILKLDPETSIIEAQSAIEIEKSQYLPNLFIVPPGTPNAAGFKDGQVNNIKTRYLTFSKKGAAINIMWFEDKLIVSTSYNGLKKIVSNL